MGLEGWAGIVIGYVLWRKQKGTRCITYFPPLPRAVDVQEHMYNNINILVNNDIMSSMTDE